MDRDSTLESDSENARPSGGGDPRRFALLAGFYRRNRDVFKHWLKFVGILGFLVAVSQLAANWLNYRLAASTAAASAFFLRILGAEGTANGVMLSAKPCNFEIIGECTAHYPMAIFIAAVLAFPCTLRRRLLGIALGIPTILMINQVRLVSLCYIRGWFPQMFETAHVLVWQSLIVFFTVLIWVVWATTLGRGDETRPT